MKFSITLTLALLGAAVNAIALPPDASSELTARDILDLTQRAPEAATDIDLDDASDIPDSAVADVDEDDEFTPDEFDFLASFEIDSDEGPNTGDALAERSQGTLEARRIRDPPIKLLLRKWSKTKLGKKVWNKVPKTKRKKITKYVKKAAKSKKKTSKETKKWIAKEVKPVAMKVVADGVGKAAAKIIINDVVPWVVDAILNIIF